MPSPVTPKQTSFVTLADDKARLVFDEALDRLSPVQRQVFLMRLRSESDLDRIAVRLGLSRDTARASLAYAVAQLRMALSDAPLDKQRDDWLQRCRRLLVRPVRRSIVPAVEIELPGAEAKVAPVPVESSALVVESRETTPAHITASPLTSSESVRPASPPSRQVVLPAASASAPTSAAPSRDSRRRAHGGLWPRLPAALAVLVLTVVGVLAWYGLRSDPSKSTVIDTEPQRMPALDAPAAPLTAPDFRLVLLRQQQDGLLEDLDFYIWLSEQDALP